MTIDELLEQKRDKVKAAEEIRDLVYSEQDGEWRGDDTAKFDGLMADVEAVSAQIDRLAKLDAQARSLTVAEQPQERRTASQMSRPQTAHKPPTEEDRRMALEGWLVGAGPGSQQMLRPEHIAAAERCGVQLGSREYTLRLSPTRGLADQRLQDVAQRFQTVGTTTEGGFAVPDDIMRSLEVAMLDFGGMRQVATVIRTDSGASLPIPELNDTTNAGQLIAETIEQTVVDMTFSQMTLDSYKYSSMRVGMSVEFLQDNAVNASGRIGEILGERIGRITNTHFTTGTGTAQPNGIVTASTAGDTAASNAAITRNELVDLKHSVDPAYRRRGGRWMFNDTTLATLKKLNVPQFSGDTGGQPLWQAGMSADAPNTIDGDPYTINQDVADIGTLAISVLYGDLSKYLIRDVRDITLVRLDERYAELGVVAFLAFYRGDGDLLDAGTNPVKHLVHPT